jgi:N-methylhydantoinase B
MSQISSVKVAADDVLHLFRKYGSDTMRACFRELIDYSERRTREALVAIPDGTYRHEEPILDDGAKGGPYWLRLALTKSGDSVTLDFTGTDAQVKGPVNSPLATTHAAVYYAMRCVTDASIPSTEGCKRPITIVAPPGTLVNARSPAAVYQRMIVCHSIVDLVMGALAQAVPDRVMGDSCGCLYNYTIVTHPETQRRTGIRRSRAGRHRCDVARRRHRSRRMPRDQLPHSADGGDRDGVAGPLHPARDARGFRRRRHVPRRRRAAVDVSHPRRLSRAAAHVAEVGLAPARRRGRQARRWRRWIINESLAGEHRLEHAIGDVEPLREGDTVTHYTPGGGGYGDPMRRDPSAVARDVRLGFVTSQAALRDYGVRVDPPRSK